MPTSTAEEAEIRQSPGLVQALRSKDIEALMAHYAPDTIVFDLRPPHRITSANAYRRNFEAWFASGAVETSPHEPFNSKASYRRLENHD